MVLEKLGGFDASLGVTGKVLRYGEEFDLQVRMRNAGFSIAYAPTLRIGHFLRKEKLNVRWMLESIYARHRDKMAFNPMSLGQSSINLVKTTFGRIIWTPIHLLKCVTRKNYSYRRACLDILQPLATSSGEWIGAWRNLKKSKS
jgi:GT2 family glycosyltransferase